MLPGGELPLILSFGCDCRARSHAHRKIQADNHCGQEKIVYRDREEHPPLPVEPAARFTCPVHVCQAGEDVERGVDAGLSRGGR